MYTIVDLGLTWRCSNNWLAESCSSDPDVYRGTAMLAREETDLAVARVERPADLSRAGAMVPTVLGQDFPRYHNTARDTLRAAAASFALPMHGQAATPRDKNAHNGSRPTSCRCGRTILTSAPLRSVTGRAPAGRKARRAKFPQATNGT